MKKIWQEIVNLLSKGESLVTATVFNTAGSAPRTAGAKMVVKGDGSIVGTIGGGRLEGEVRELAREVFITKAPFVKAFELTGADAAQMDMICGGKGEVLLDYIDGEDKLNLEIYRGILEVLMKKEKAWLITALSTKDSGYRQQCLVKKDGTLLGRLDCESDFLEKLIKGPAKITIHSQVWEDRRLLVEPIRNTGTVFIFGAGHVSQQIVPLAERVGFKTVVLDDRKEYANKERFPESEIILLSSFSKPLPPLDIDEDSYLVIVTRGHLHDKTVLEQVLPMDAAYIGMIGSKRKRDMIYRALKEEKGFTDEDLKRVYSPIGIEILAETPEEIAVSVVAELIKVRAEREQ